MIRTQYLNGVQWFVEERMNPHTNNRFVWVYQSKSFHGGYKSWAYHK